MGEPPPQSGGRIHAPGYREEVGGSRGSHLQDTRGEMLRTRDSDVQLSGKQP